MACISRLIIPLSETNPSNILVERRTDKSKILPAFNGRFIAFSDDHYFVILNCYGLKIIPKIINFNDIDIFNFEKIELPSFSTIYYPDDIITEELLYGKTYYLKMNGFKLLFNIRHEGISFTSNNAIINRNIFNNYECDIGRVNDLNGFDFAYFPAITIKKSIHPRKLLPDNSLAC